jgi:glycosyltransferase involved in cell wall biosynthesis
MHRIKTIYLLPSPGINGGMVAITKMYFEYGLFDNSFIKHFNTSFVTKWMILRFFESLIKKICFIFLLVYYRPKIIFVMSSSYWGFYDKIFYCMIARIFMIKSIFNPVGGAFSDFYESNLFNKLFVRLFLLAPNIVMVGSNFWENYFRERFPGITIKNVPNPINSLKFKQNSFHKNGNLKIVSISHIIANKGIRELASVIENVCKSTDNIEFIIIGDGNLRDWLETSLKQWITNDRVKVLGLASETKKVEALKNADIFILLSYFELIPISILEAMASSLPIIATKIGGIPDLVEDQVNGFLFEPREVNQVVKKIIELSFLQKDQIMKFGKFNFEKVYRTYDINVVLKQHSEIIKSLLIE